MTENKKIDDYYSSLHTAVKKDEKKAKPKVKKVVKKKIVIKKTVKKPEKLEKNQEVLQKTELKKGRGKKSDSGPKQKIEVIKREKVPASSKISVVKKGEQKKSQEKTTFKERGSGNTQNKQFKKSAPTNTSYKEKEEEKKGKTFKKKSKTRGRFKDYALVDEPVFTRSKTQKIQKKVEKKVEDIKQNLVEKKGETVTISDIISLKEFSEKIGVTLPMLIAEFMKNGMMVNINSKIDFDSASIVAEAFEVNLERDTSAGASVEDILLGDISELLKEDDPSKLQLRAPVVSIMGHVDHGKTSLLDHIRKSKVASGEAGGITQSIGAYQVELESGKITFLDTPGHEAFTVMRARGAKSTDIAILVVAADEGVKPQTIESINHAKEAEIPVVVAINKMDKEGANPDHVKGQLSEHGLTPEDWGGDTPMVPVSAHTGFGIDELLEILLLVAEMKELKANPDRNGVATVIESHLDNSLGPVSTVLVNNGTINSGDNIVCGSSYGKIKVLKNHKNQKVRFAKPGEPVLIVGLDQVVEGGDILQVVNTPEIAKQKAGEYRTIIESKKKAAASSLDMIMSRIKAGNLKQLKIILKADTNGSLEAIKGSLLKLSTDETSVSIIHSGVGLITEGDILMGQGSQAILVGFNVGILPNARTVLESSGVEFISSQIIYHITERIEKIISGMLDPKEVEVVLGKAKVLEIFFTEKKFMIVGLQLGPDNAIENKADIRIFRKKQYLGGGKVGSLQQGTLEVKKVEGPLECGIKFEGNTTLEPGDELEFYKIEIHK